jgi:hypothetical protein
MKRNKGFEYPLDKQYTYADDLKNLGNDYSKNLMKNSVSHIMYANSYVKVLLDNYIEPALVKLINSVKFIRVYFNIAVDKNYKNIN